MNISTSSTPQELQQALGARIRRLRLRRDLDQMQTAARAGLSEKALRNLESGRGSTVETLLRVLKALDALSSLEALAPLPSVSPLALLDQAGEPQRVSRPRKRRASGQI